MRLRAHFKNRHRGVHFPPWDINRHGYRVFSQHREDGIIDYLLDHLPSLNRRFVEIGFAADQCNCLNMLINRNYRGVFIDANPQKCATARTLLRRLAADRAVIAECLVDIDNINPLLSDLHFSRNIDVLSIDIDGNDFWIFEAIETDAKIVVVEYNASFGIERSISVPYSADFDRYRMHPSGLYHSASLRAFERLGMRKGYSLVAVDNTGVNAFFVRDDFVDKDIKRQSAEKVFRSHRSRTRYKKLSEERQYEMVADMPFVEVS
ncbi:MAG: hypothetical protein DHS20C01_09990 [marine bacterium B5-7]|nr:MAG: hypothetical protein DHS20C01_09990 [marine bacterium B5-7]